jgi:ATP-dependent helicase/nuclease subunit A
MSQLLPGNQFLLAIQAGVLMSLLSQFSFTDKQKEAITDASPAIVVTAGAGSGKTRSLVGRYLHVLEQGYPIRSILAITFTEKAAREMRSRIRNALSRTEHSTFNVQLFNLDSARIGTIHSLCAELLRAHPAEAGLDPAFEVLEEGLASALQAEAIESSLAWAANDSPSAALFESFKENELREILKSLLSRRLDVSSLPLGEGPGVREQFSNSLSSHLATHLDSQSWIDSLAILNQHRSSSPEDKLELARQSVLAAWDESQKSRAVGQWDDVLTSLTALRKSISTQGQKKNWDDIDSVHTAMTDLRSIYDGHLKFIAEKSRFSLDEKLADSLPAIHRLFDQTLLEYTRLKQDRLDFDDLEGLTAQLLMGHPEICVRLHSELRAVLVDEFQDTNDRQRQIVYALTGFNSGVAGLKPPAQKLDVLRAGARESASADFHELRQDFSPPNPPIENRKSETLAPGASAGVVKSNPCELFVVGDAKQSIYRFRRADVTVFRQVQRDIHSSGGELIDLDLSFRTHKPLLEALNFLLAPILGETDDPARPYAVPFAPLRAYRQQPVRENIKAPFIEFHLGLGENAEEGRAASAQALATRLSELHQNEGFAWGDMALLFRSSTAFEAYETALEKADIPFVTVAGRGFYDRPEIRDLLNILAAIADPTDDLALVGALRSPAFAIPDSEIYKLRFPHNSTTPAKIFDSLKEQVDRYTGKQVDRDTGTHVQADNGTRSTQHEPDLHPSSFILHSFFILQELYSLSSRAPAAAILKRLFDLTHYRAILSTAPNGLRMIRNVEKLLADAHRSRLVSLTDFLAYLQTLRDVGLREGEAPADASSSGAVQLMTVHKAKGLEFPLTVIADAAYEHRGNFNKTQLADTLLLDLRDDGFHATAWQLASRLEDDRSEAEDNRLLYVAATRAKEKLLISGHVKQNKDGLSYKGWLSKFDLLQEISTPEHSLLENGISAKICPSSQTDASDSPQPDSVSTNSPLLSGEGAGVRSMLNPLAPNLPLADDKTRARESDQPQRVWRIVSKTRKPHAPAWLVGRLVHESLRRWRFDNLDDFLKPLALEAGLTDEDEIHAAIQESRRMLERFHAHPLFKELDSAKCHHEVPYFSPDGRGIIDLLYHSNNDWTIIDFKTDEVRSDEEARGIIEQKEYNLQVARYAQAIESQLQVKAKTRLVFLNVKGEVKVYE